MRRFLLILLFLPILFGCLVSTAHGVGVPKLLSGSGKHQSSAKKATGFLGRQLFEADSSYISDSEDGDIDDDDFCSNLLFKKLKPIPRYLPADYYNVAVTSLKRCNLSLAAIHGDSVPKYIAQMIFRV